MTDLPSPLRVLFIHGKESSPQGLKARRLAEQFQVFGEQMDTSDFEGSVALQARALKDFAPHVAVGSSFGGAVLSELLARRLYVGGSLLLAPATRLYDPQACLPAFAAPVIVHGTLDEVVPIALSREFAKTAPRAVLHCVHDDHRLSHTVQSGALFDYVREAYRLHASPDTK